MNKTLILLTLFLGSLLIALSFFLFLIMSKNFCWQDDDCKNNQVCSMFSCKNPPPKPKPIAAPTPPKPTVILPPEPPPTDTWCQKSCVYNQLSSNELLNKYGVNSYDFEQNFKNNMLPQIYNANYQNCLNTVNIEDSAKDQHCQKIAHGNCVVQCQFKLCQDLGKTNTCLFDVKPNPEGWNCICYQEIFEGANTNLTVCRRKPEECEILQNKVIVATKSKTIVSDSLSRECTYIGNDLPWKNGYSQFEDWSPSKFKDKNNMVGLQSYAGCKVQGGSRSPDEMLTIIKDKKQKLFESAYGSFLSMPDNELFVNCMLQRIPDAYFNKLEQITSAQFQKNSQYCSQNDF